MRRLMILVLVIPWWIVGCVSAPARTAGHEAIGGVFDGAEEWWSGKRAEVLAGAKDAAIDLARGARDEAVRMATDAAAPRIDAAVDRAAARAHELVDARLGETGAAVKDLVLAQVEPRVTERVDALRADLLARGWSPESTVTPGAVLAESGRRAASGEWDEARAGLVTFLGMLLALGVRGGVRMVGQRLPPTGGTPTPPPQ